MNYTTFFYCDCGFEKALTEGGEYQVLQCESCYTIASIKKEMKYSIECSACGETEMIEGDFELKDDEKKCHNCGIKGAVGFKEFNHDALFFVEAKFVFEGECGRCKKIDWFEPTKHELKCPTCFRNLKQKMSSAW